MKNLTSVLFVVLLVSCGNKKAEIVEQIQIYKDSVISVKREIVGLSIDDRNKYEEIYYTNGELDDIKLRNKELRKLYISHQAKIGFQKFQLQTKQARFQNKIDSLELELKKY